MYQHFINAWSSKDWLKADKEEEEEEGKDNAEKTDGKAAEEKEDGTESPLLFPSVDLGDECEDSKQRSTEALGKMLPAERKLADEQYRQQLQKGKKKDLLTNLHALEALEAMPPDEQKRALAAQAVHRGEQSKGEPTSSIDLGWAPVPASC